MDIEVLEKKINTLTEQQQSSVESYIEFLISQNFNQYKSEKKPLDFTKYNTNSHIWNEDAQEYVNRIRSNDRF